MQDCVKYDVRWPKSIQLEPPKLINVRQTEIDLGKTMSKMNLLVYVHDKLCGLCSEGDISEVCRSRRFLDTSTFHNHNPKKA